MSAKELASARSHWKRRNLRDGRRSRYVEVEEVSLDTLRADAVESGLVDKVVSILATGKEADVYVGLWKNVPLGLKVYRLHRTPHKKKSMIGYSMDRVGQIAANEFTILEKAYRAGIPVPTPARRVDNMFTMRFLGDASGAARLLKDIEIENPRDIAEQTMNIIQNLLLNGFLIHGDLSEYNLLLYQERVYVIDFPQAIDLSSRVNRQLRFENAKPLLLRDIENVVHYFDRYDVEIDTDTEYNQLVSSFAKLHLQNC
jgi:RIO kinase 1